LSVSQADLKIKNTDPLNAAQLPYCHPTDVTVHFHDDALLVVNKPAGLLSVPGRGEDKQDCLSARVQRDFPDALIVHRLDMATSGLMLMARGVSSQRSLNHAFSERQVNKTYVAVVAGHLASPEAEWGVINLPISVDWPRRPLRIIDPLHGKPSLTRWRVLQHLEYPPGQRVTRVELEPVTGRSHQLRVHLQAMGHSILGDALYASAIVQQHAPRLLLHANRLSFAHPTTGERLGFSCQPAF
jgi:tRNA pseudouridine32 synthase/23S rRNA pseudouridine746 synthase